MLGQCTLFQELQLLRINESGNLTITRKQFNHTTKQQEIVEFHTDEGIWGIFSDSKRADLYYEKIACNTLLPSTKIIPKEVVVEKLHLDKYCRIKDHYCSTISLQFDPPLRNLETFFIP